MPKIVCCCLLLALLAFPQLAMASAPDCSKPNNWASNGAFTYLKNAGLLQNETTDFSKTKVTRLASEKIGNDLYRQVHQITFAERSGQTLTVITVNDASHQECSMSGVKVFVVSQELGELGQ
jgi:hypothetical protein